MKVRRIQMKVLIFQIGGDKPETFLGLATDTATLKSLIRLAELSRASGVSLRGTMPHLRETVSGEFTLTDAYAECTVAEIASHQGHLA